MPAARDDPPSRSDTERLLARETARAADQRDADADARDQLADHRDYEHDLAAFMDPDTVDYERESSARHDAAEDRAEARSERVSAAKNRAAQTEG